MNSEAILPNIAGRMASFVQKTLDGPYMMWPILCALSLYSENGLSHTDLLVLDFVVERVEYALADADVCVVSYPQLVAVVCFP